MLYIIRSSLRSNISEDEYYWIYRNKKYTNFCICYDVAIASRNKNALKDVLVNTQSEATRIIVNGDYLRCGKHEFEHVKEFSYLGSQLNQTNSTNSKIQAKILSGNHCYYAYEKLMKSRVLNRSSKLKIYNSLMRPIVTYGCEAWTLTN